MKMTVSENENKEREEVKQFKQDKEESINPMQNVDYQVEKLRGWWHNGSNIDILVVVVGVGVSSPLLLLKSPSLLFLF